MNGKLSVHFFIHMKFHPVLWKHGCVDFDYFGVVVR